MEGRIRDGDVSGAVRVRSSDESVAAPSVEVLEALRAKHPSAFGDIVLPPVPDQFTPATDVTAAEIISAITSFPNGSAGGVDGLKPQHLKDLITDSAGMVKDRLCEELAKLVTLMLNGKVLEEICPILYGASLTALKKKDGGLRPIAVGCTLRRLAGKVVSRRVMNEIGDLVRPIQLGYGTRGGAEAAVHATRAYITEESAESQVLLKLDFKNAFNTVDRAKMLEEVKDHLPMYYAFIWQMYTAPSHLFFGEHRLSSECGVQQGDPLGPLLFSLVTRRLSAAMISPLNCWYLDDGVIGGEIAGVAVDLETVVEEGKAVGLELNMAKCEVFIFGGDDDTRDQTTEEAERLFPGVQFPTASELSLLGAPLLPEALETAIEQKKKTIQRLTSRLALLH